LLIVAMLGLLLRPAVAEKVSLGVEEAIGRALETNLRTRLARERIVEAEAGLQAAYAAYAPKVSVEAGQYNRSVNLASQGLSGSDLPVPNRIGPFFSFESRLQVLYRVYDPARSWGVRAGEIEKHVSELKSDMENDAVKVLTSGTYILLLEALEKQRVSEADVALGERLEVQARNLEQAGVAAGVDLTRAQTRLAQRRLQLTQDQEQVRNLQRQLLRLTGLPLTDQVALQDDLLRLPNPFPATDETIGLAREARLEIRLAEEQVALTDARIHQTEAEDAPTLDLVGSAGIAGNTPTSNSTFIHNVGISLTWPIFNGGLTEAETNAAKSRQAQAEMQLEDTLVQVESEVRDAYSQLLTAQESMATAEQAVSLASQELEMTQDRFQVGLTNNVELLASEEALANANFSRLQALANYNVALIRLASASGRPDLLLNAFRQAKEQKGTSDE
jgi:outer membrane protein TolC